MRLQDQLQTAQARLTEIGDEIEAIGMVATEEDRELTDADLTALDSKQNEFTQAEKRIEYLSKAVAIKDREAAARAVQTQLQASVGPQSPKLPAVPLRQKSKIFENNLEAYAMGQWVNGVVGNEPSRRWCKENGYGFRGAMETGTDSAGGYTVPDPLAATIIRLVEEVGVFRR